ncbi:OmpA family protein [Pedobacter polaris]|uniref:OmpA family protein n=1 Tax=Pedobacter polaris TaxID=2571273 RepID=A0A4U1CTU1_9SPHI|nr:OmpA family protein [Pedobacter polaris]TKC10525.1 OmpA family protein [Pedobacter polaris]
MAHLEVEPKPKRPLWIWILLAITLVALAAMLLRKCDAEQSDVQRAAMADSTNAIASTVPDWNSVDFNSATSTDVDITDQEIQTRGNGTYTIYTLGENILFPTDGNDVSENGQAKLKIIADALNKKFEGATIGVFGSTDSTGPADENKDLGKQRAEAVKNWLTSSGGVPSGTVSVQSLGETQPVATNQTSEGRKQNRNVSIVVFPKQ